MAPRRYDHRDGPVFDDDVEDGAVKVRRLRRQGVLPPGERMSRGGGTSQQEVAGLEEQGAKQHHARRRERLAKAPRGWHSPTLHAPRRLSVADGSGFALGLVLYALGVNYLRHGPAGVRGWMAAKFLNRPDPTLAPPARAGKVRPPAPEKLRALPRRKVSA